MNTDNPKQGSFVWPPANAEQPGEARSTPENTVKQASFDTGVRPRNGAIAAIAELLSAFEKQWIGVSSPPLAQRLAEAGERFESPGEACWRCAGSVGAGEVDGDGCAACRPRKLAWDRALRLGEYDGVLGEAVRQVKFTGWRRLGDDLGRALGRRLVVARSSWAPNAATPIIVPVPMSRRARLARGVDHTLALARGVRAETGWPIVRALRQRHGPPQHRLPAGKRAANVRNRFRATPAGVESLASQLPGPGEGPGLVILLDDVRTTGATLTAAAKTLRTGVKTGLKMGGTGLKNAALKDPDQTTGRPEKELSFEVWAVTTAVTIDESRSSRDGGARTATGGASEGASLAQNNKNEASEA